MKAFLSFLPIFTIFLIITNPQTGFANEELDERAVSAKARLVPYQIEPTQNVVLEIDLEILEGYSTYAEMYELTFKTQNSGFKLGKFYIHPVKTFFDQTSKKKREGVTGKALLKAPLEAPEALLINDEKLEFFLTYQACTKTYCLFPKTIELTANFTWGGPRGTDVNRNIIKSTPALFDLFKSFNFKDLYYSRGTLFILLSLFILGIFTSLTPCIYPLIPITLSVLGREAHSRSKKQNLIAANIYVIGMALSYAGLGVLAASSGLLFGSFVNSPWVLSLVCLVFLSMSLSSFGVFEVQMPSRLQFMLQTTGVGHGYFKIFFTGLIAGLVAGPCVGPILIGVLTFVSQTQDLWLGFWSLFAFALGMGQLLLILGLGGGIVKYLPKSGVWMNSVKYFFGTLLLGMFYYYLNMLLPRQIWQGSLGVGLITLGSFFFYTIRKPDRPFYFILKGFSLATLLFGVFLIFWSVMGLGYGFSNNADTIHGASALNREGALSNWTRFSNRAYQIAINSGKPIILDFYADWCAACLELEKKTFVDPKFIELTRDFNLLRFDATKESDDLKRLKAKYNILGLPTLIFYDKSGKIRPELEVNQFITTDEFQAIFQAL